MNTRYACTISEVTSKTNFSDQHSDVGRLFYLMAYEKEYHHWEKYLLLIILVNKNFSITVSTGIFGNINLIFDLQNGFYSLFIYLIKMI